MKNNKQLPEVGKNYFAFDDGKISVSRRYEVVVKEIIPFKNIDNETLNQWEIESKACHWLYSEKTDYFVKAFNGENIEIFVRTKNNGWFSMGFLNSGRLDVDGKLNNLI